MKCFTGVAQSALRVLLSGGYPILQAEQKESSTVYLLPIRHHRQLSFDFASLWPGAGREDV